MSNVFVIINEWTAIDNSSHSDIVDSKYFDSEESAWRALREIAHSYDDDLDYDATSISYENSTVAVQYEEYYIQELTQA